MGNGLERHGRTHAYPAAFVVLGGLLAAAALTGACATTAPSEAASPQPLAAQPAMQPAAHRGEPFVSEELGFELNKPEGNAWSQSTDVTSPEGRPIPLVLAHEASGAQVVVQVSQAVSTPEKLVQMLRTRLSEEKWLKVGAPRKIAIDSGAEAYGFDFDMKEEAKGRVAVIRVGEQVVLVVASWPPDADKRIPGDIDELVRSVRPTSGAVPTLLRPDKA